MVTDERTAGPTEEDISGFNPTGEVFDPISKKKTYMSKWTGVESMLAAP